MSIATEAPKPDMEGEAPDSSPTPEPSRMMSSEPAPSPTAPPCPTTAPPHPAPLSTPRPVNELDALDQELKEIEKKLGTIS